MGRKLAVGKKAFSMLAVGDENARLLWTVPANTTFIAQILCGQESIISGDFCHYYVSDSKELVWVHTGKGDPCEKLDVQPRFSLIIPMLIKVGDDEKVQRNVRFPKSVGRKLESLMLSSDSIRNLVVKVTRDDTGQWASYNIESTGKMARATSYEFDEAMWLDAMLEEIIDLDAPAVEHWLQTNGVAIGGKSKVGSSAVTEIDF